MKMHKEIYTINSYCAPLCLTNNFVSEFKFYHVTSMLESRMLRWNTVSYLILND